MPTYETKHLDECFDRLKLLSNEISTLCARVDAPACTNEELQRSVVFCQLAGELREIVLRYRDDIEDNSPDGILKRCVSWACAALGEDNP